ncbi:MacB family efflux pump subunit [Neorhizobium sp. JUb45]|uniref:MacB family efflux pump subunit n=1 Tax=unclassified Neorhizobium TaxID=2629175 RepID=UPI001051338F|nr:MacB family efflux pump subunit [Neorhizobium sp. JUb45]TCR00049.1 macrolide transport system ATP-binding/permease protein [Neorhizobium sp. JUb45]
MTEPLISLSGLRREYASGDGTITVLKDVDLTIERGEMVAIIGASGSGKSTLMNILGLLDRPTAGTYRISGHETSALDNDDRSALRREHFGFIFQRYHLLDEISALANVEIPAVYAGRDRGQRRERAAALLGRLGMADRTDHRPGHLSGGQQQRVSIARALMNDAEVILADEPTGALDKTSGEEVLRILDELHAEGRTIIIVTHDASVAARAERIIEISDGEIISDTRSETARHAPAKTETETPTKTNRVGAGMERFREAFLMACKALTAHRMRSFLTMLGIIIGIASVISVVALGTGSQQKVLANISSLGTNTLEVFPGAGFGDMRSGRVKTLLVSDAEALAKLSYVAAATPTVSTNTTARFGATEANALVNGVGSRYFEVKGSKLLAGRLFDDTGVAAMEQDAVIDENTAKTLFGTDVTQAIGQVVLVGSVPCRVIGVISAQQGGFGSSDNLSIYLPYTSVQTRFTGDQSLRSVTLRISDDAETSVAEQAVTTFLTGRHGTKDFFILNTDDIRQTITSTTQTMTLLIGAIAVISLIVGGIGVMNIMLVSVSERVSEIGVRMAVGARRQDILQQFLIEAVLVCMIGGVLGVALALLFGFTFSLFGSSFSLVFTTAPIVLAVLSSCLIGIAFGYLPARNASRLDPVAALT